MKTTRKTMPRPKRSVTLRDIFKEFEPVYIAKHKHHCTVTQAANIVRYFHELVREGLVSGELTEYQMPSRLGVISIVRRKTPDGPKRKLNYKLTNQVDKKIFHTNKHSYGYYAMYKHFKRNAIFKYKSIYTFKPVRRSKKVLKDAIINRNTILKYLPA